MLTTYSYFGSGEGKGVNRNIFPADYPVIFNALCEGGPVANSEWSFNCSVDSFEPINATGYTLQKQFSNLESQNCSVSVDVRNDFSSAGNLYNFNNKSRKKVRISFCKQTFVCVFTFSPEGLIWPSITDTHRDVV